MIQMVILCEPPVIMVYSYDMGGGFCRVFSVFLAMKNTKFYIRT